MTILDILGILLPGFIWLILTATTIELVLAPQFGLYESPMAGVLRIVNILKGTHTWFGVIALFVCALLIGYVLKPIAMAMAGAVCGISVQEQPRSVPVQRSHEEGISPLL